jgi:hypothetical protein
VTDLLYGDDLCGNHSRRDLGRLGTAPALWYEQGQIDLGIVQYSLYTLQVVFRDITIFLKPVGYCASIRLHWMTLLSQLKDSCAEPGNTKLLKGIKGGNAIAALKI